MKKFESNKLLIKRSAEDIFNFLGDFTNFEGLMPEEIINWEATADNCSFTIRGMTSLAMKIEERTPHSRIRILPDGKAPFDFELVCLMNGVEEKVTETRINLHASLNPLYSMVASQPLYNLVNIMVNKLKEVMEGDQDS